MPGPKQFLINRQGKNMGHYALKNKIAVVTGGASGIGEVISRTLAANGAKLGLLDYAVLANL